jgi:O-antigen/teichoic acid export membrane protein
MLFCNTTILAAYFAGKNFLRINLAGSAICFVSILVADLLLIPSFGMKGAAIASSTGYALSCIFSVTVYCRQTGTPVGHLFYPRAGDWNNLRSALNKIILKKA